MNIININDQNIYEVNREEELKLYERQHRIDMFNFTAIKNQAKVDNPNIDNVELDSNIPKYDQLTLLAKNFTMDQIDFSIKSDIDFIFKVPKRSLLIKFTQEERVMRQGHLIDRDEIPHEATISRFTNELRKMVPNFSYIIDWGIFQLPNLNVNGESNGVETNNKDARRYIVYEYIPGPTWNTWLRSCSVTRFNNCYIQIISSIKLGLKRFNMTHYDLHPGNIIIRPLINDIDIDYEDFSLRVSEVATQIDFGTCHVTTKDGIHLGKAMYSKFGIYSNRSFWIIDAFKLLMFSAYYTSLQYSKETNDDVIAYYTDLRKQVEYEIDVILEDIINHENLVKRAPSLGSQYKQLLEKNEEKLVELKSKMGIIDDYIYELNHTPHYTDIIINLHKQILIMLEFFLGPKVDDELILSYMEKKRYFECYPTINNLDIDIDTYITYLKTFPY
jgi:hypothetical protein